MPDKPIWTGRLDQLARDLEALSDSWVDRSLIEALLGVGRRRAQQLLAPCVTRQVGKSGLARKTDLLEHLRRLAGGDQSYFERRRRVHLAEQLDRFRQARLETPEVLVEAPVSVMRQKLEGLPDGVALAPGEITLRFASATEALEKLLALAMAIGNEREKFEQAVTIAN